MKYYNKLVRDKIPSLINAQGKKAICRIITDEKELFNLLCDKLIEEANELKNANSEDNRLEEFADVSTVVFEICRQIITDEYLINKFDRLYTEKLCKKGNFLRHVFLEGVIE